MRRGDRVALFMHNSPQFVIAYYGILRADAVVVPINCMNTTGELEHLLRDAGATTIVTAQELQPRVEPLLGETVNAPSSPATQIMLAMKRPPCCPRRWPRRASNSGSRRSLTGTKCSSRRTRPHRTRPGPTILR